MYWQIIFWTIFALGTIGESSCSPIVIKTNATPATAGCEMESPTSPAEKDAPQAPPAQNHVNVMGRLDRVSKLDFLGHPAPLKGLLWLIEHKEGDEFAGWSIPVTVDRQALMRHGIRLDELVLSELRAGGVRRRSSLRFVFGVSGLAYYVNNENLVVTTKEIARAKWLGELPKPRLKSLGTGSVAERRDVAFALGFWRGDPDVWVNPLVQALTDTDRDVRFDVAYALGEMGPTAEKAIVDLLKLLKSEDLTLREAAVFALGKIGPKATTGLLKLIDDPDSAIAIAAAKSVGVMGSVGNQAIPGLIKAATRHIDNEELCDRIATSIAAIDLGDTIPKLRELVKSEEAGIRSFAATTIAKMGPLGQSCASDLLPLLTDPKVRVRIAAAYALASIDLPSDFPTIAIQAAVKDSNEYVRAWSRHALRVIKSNK
jgi:HEAT repeat protein